MWLEDEGCHDVVKATWRRAVRGSPMAMVEGKINMCQLKLKWWSQQHFGNITRALLEKKSLLKKAKVVACGNGFYGEVVGLKLKFNEILMQEERMWHQRAKSHQITLGDRNTKFFHSRASQSYRRNKYVVFETVWARYVQGMTMLLLCW